MLTCSRAMLRLVLVGAALVGPARAETPGQATGSVVELTRPGIRNLGLPGEDRSGRLLKGTAGVMTSRLRGERQAGGQRFDPSAGVAASSVLPLGATVRVTNLSNGRVAWVQVTDVAPRGSRHLVDLSPATARALGLQGEAEVQVAPLAVPQADGTVRMGDGTGLRGQVAAAAVSARPED